jgi:hypothetical protein
MAEMALDGITVFMLKCILTSKFILEHVTHLLEHFSNRLNYLYKNPGGVIVMIDYVAH